MTTYEYICQDCGSTLTDDGEGLADEQGERVCPMGMGTHTPEG